jgi:NADH-quinone oxidoreductase subunit M
MNFSEIPWVQQSGYPILTLLQLLPLLAAGLMMALRRSSRVAAAGIIAAMLELALMGDLLARYDRHEAAMQFAEHLDLFGLSYHAAVDGIGIVFMLLTALITLLVSIYGPVCGLGPAWRFLAVLFAIESTLMALFSTVNLLWFALLSIVQLGLVGYILWRWTTSPDKDMALTRFYQFMGVGILLLVIGTLMLSWNHAHVTGGRWTFDLFELSTAPVSGPFQSVVFFLLFYGMAVRTPLFPFHGWLPLIAEHGDIAVAPTLLLGVKIGIYGMLRFVFPLLPEAVQQWHYHAAAFAVVGVFYAALLAMMQDNLRRLLAFAVVSHTSLIVIGLFSLDHLAFQGSVILSVTFGLAAATLMFMTGLIYRRTRTTRLPRLGGLFDRIPFLGITFLIAGLSIIGMPGTPGFDAAHLVMEASIHQYGALPTIAAALGNVVTAGFLLWAFQRAFLAPCPAGEPYREVEPASRSEVLVAGLIVVVLLGAGFYSEPWLELIDKPLEGLSALYATH